jgi:hypothetical protein
MRKGLKGKGKGRGSGREKNRVSKGRREQAPFNKRTEKNALNGNTTSLK